MAFRRLTVTDRDLRETNGHYVIKMRKDPAVSSHFKDWEWCVYAPDGGLVSHGMPFCGFGRISAYLEARQAIRAHKRKYKVYRVK